MPPDTRSKHRPRRASHRGDLTERMVLIPLKLAERPHTQRELAAAFGASGRTIRRDITVLTAHYPILDELDGHEVRYLFRDGYKYVPPAFTPSELATVLLAQEAIAATGLTSFGTPFAGFGRALLAKARAALPDALRAKLDALATVFGSAAAPAKDYAPHAETIDKLTTAAAERRRVRLRYHTLHTDKVEERDFEPYAVYFDPDGATLKVIGYDHKRRDIIPLSIDHVLHLTDTGEEFARPPDFDLQAHLAEHCFNGIHGEPLTVRLRAHGVTARIFAERKFHRSHREIERTPKTAEAAETITIEMRVARGRGLVRFILSWSPDVEVLSPPELRREVAAALRGALARGEASGTGEQEGAGEDG
jgi:predicted DNA-binding transcriptional regulator YafY